MSTPSGSASWKFYGSLGVHVVNKARIANRTCQTLNFGGETRGEASPEYPPESVEAVESLQQHNNILATQELLNHGFEVLWPRSSGGLFWAAKEGKMDVIRLLLRHGADLSATNSEGTLAHSAAAGGHVEVLQLLLENQIPLDQRQQYPDGWTPLHSAVKCKQESAVAFLLQQGAHPNTKVENGWTALHCSAEQGSTGIAKILLENGARVTAKDLKGSTPLHLLWDLLSEHALASQH
jgi:ankyrin repeat protein